MVPGCRLENRIFITRAAYALGVQAWKAAPPDRLFNGFQQTPVFGFYFLIEAKEVEAQDVESLGNLEKG